VVERFRSRHEHIDIGTKSAENVERVSRVSLVCLLEEADSSDRGAACQAEFMPAYTVPDGARQWHEWASWWKDLSIR